jgi:uncharacterized membrane protein
LIVVTLYTRQNCPLCEQVIADLKEIQSQVPHELKIVNIEGDPKLEKAFGEQIPVVEVGPYQLKAPISRIDLLISLKATDDRDKQYVQIDQAIAEGKIVQPVSYGISDQISEFLANHYIALINIFILFYLGVPFLAPVLMKVGAEPPARMIYKVYSMTCHQLAYRSWFLFGEQAVYPREVAGVKGLIPYEQISGSQEIDLLAARTFIGNELVGYKVALCERDVAIYGGILIFGLVFSLTGRKMKSLPWYLWLLIGIVPIAVDGLSQLMSQPPLSFFPLRESTPFLRTLTGFLFGFTTAWFGYPLVEESMKEIRQYQSTKKARAKAKKEPIVAD